MTLEMLDKESRIILVLDAEVLTHEGEDLFRGAYLSALAEGKDVIIDLTDVQFLDSRRLAAFVICFKKAAEMGRKVVLCCLQGAVREALHMSRLEKVFPLAPTRAEAEAMVE